MLKPLPCKEKVTDAETGEDLPGANIVVKSETVQTCAAILANGQFEVKRIPAGSYTVVFTGHKMYWTINTVN